MALPYWELEKSHGDSWVVLDRAFQVVDSGLHLGALQRKHGHGPSRRTFYFVSHAREPGESQPHPRWSLNALLPAAC